MKGKKRVKKKTNKDKRKGEIQEVKKSKGLREGTKEKQNKRR